MQRPRLALGVMLVCFATSSIAYQTDFHYGMTYWLGAKAGLTSEESEYLASGNEWKDTGMLDARPVVAYAACYKNDPFAFSLAREHHFRASEDRPGPAALRQVKPSTGYAEKDVLRLIGETKPAAPGGSRANKDIIDFGGALHGFQDTYAHQGVSQAIPGCNPEATWTHPQIRNGDTGRLPNWLGKGADETYRWASDCEYASQKSYDHLRNFVAKLFPSRKRAPIWNAAMGNEVRAFCRKSTKSEKVDWLHSHGVPQVLAIMDSSSLVNGAGNYEYELFRRLGLKGFAPVKVEDMAPEARKLDLDMARLAANVDKVAITPEERMVLDRYLEALAKGPASALPERLAPLVRGASGVLPATEPVLIVSQRMRFVDRALATQDPLPVNLLTNANSDIGAIPAGLSANWQSFFVNPRGQPDNQPYVLARKPGFIIAFALMRHAPYEVIRIELKAGGTFAIVSAVDIMVLH